MNNEENKKTPDSVEKSAHSFTEANELDGFYIERIDLIDMVETEQEAKDIVDKLSANNDDECVYKYRSSKPTAVAEPVNLYEELKTWLCDIMPNPKYTHVTKDDGQYFAINNGKRFVAYKS